MDSCCCPIGNSGFAFPGMSAGSCARNPACTKPLLFLVLDRPRKRPRWGDTECGTPCTRKEGVQQESQWYPANPHVDKQQHTQEGLTKRNRREKKKQQQPELDATEVKAKLSSAPLSGDETDCASKKRSLSALSSTLSSHCPSSSGSSPLFVRLKWDDHEMGGSPVKSLQPFLRDPDGSSLIFRRVRSGAIGGPQEHPSEDEQRDGKSGRSSTSRSAGGEDGSIHLDSLQKKGEKHLMRQNGSRVEASPPSPSTRHHGHIGRSKIRCEKKSETADPNTMKSPWSGYDSPPFSPLLKDSGVSFTPLVSTPSSSSALHLQKVCCGHQVVVLNCTADLTEAQETMTGSEERGTSRRALPPASAAETPSLSSSFVCASLPPSSKLAGKVVYVWDEAANEKWEEEALIQGITELTTREDRKGNDEGKVASHHTRGQAAIAHRAERIDTMQEKREKHATTTPSDAPSASLPPSHLRKRERAGNYWKNGIPVFTLHPLSYAVSSTLTRPPPQQHTETEADDDVVCTAEGGEAEQAGERRKRKKNEEFLCSPSPSCLFMKSSEKARIGKPEDVSHRYPLHHGPTTPCVVGTSHPGCTGMGANEKVEQTSAGFSSSFISFSVASPHRILPPSSTCNYWEKASEELVEEVCQELVMAYYEDPMASLLYSEEEDGDGLRRDKKYLQDLYFYPDHRKDDEYDSNAEDFEGNDYPEEEEEGEENEGDLYEYDCHHEEEEVDYFLEEEEEFHAMPYSLRNRKRDEWERRVTRAYHQGYAAANQYSDCYPEYLPGYEDEDMVW